MWAQLTNPDGTKAAFNLALAYRIQPASGDVPNTQTIFWFSGSSPIGVLEPYADIIKLLPAAPGHRP
jgi:hypothetical protein